VVIKGVNRGGYEVSRSFENLWSGDFNLMLLKSVPVFNNYWEMRGEDYILYYIIFYYTIIEYNIYLSSPILLNITCYLGDML